MRQSAKSAGWHHHAHRRFVLIRSSSVTHISLEAEAWCAGLRKLAVHSLMESAYDRCTV